MSFEQHDVQELCRVLFDAIEQSFALAGVDQSSSINNLYQGKMASYVRCEECQTESRNEQNFMDLSLPIKNEFGTGVLNSSVEMALENYIKPEKLEGDN
jgi:ubiquitin carboxyl-terminal hydrolase 47